MAEILEKLDNNSVNNLIENAKNNNDIGAENKVIIEENENFLENKEKIEKNFENPLKNFPKENLENIIFDFDDTLVYTNKFFDEAREEAIAEIKKFAINDSVDEIYCIINRLDIQCVHHCGTMGIHCFPLALGEAYRYYCQKYNKFFQEKDYERLVFLGKSVYNKPVPAISGATEVLECLSKQYTLILLSQADLENQTKRIKSSGLDKYFQKIIIVPKKDEETYKRVLMKNSLDPSKTLMIGNSIKSDINPAGRVGLKTILVDIATSWEFEREEQEYDCPVIRDLKDLLLLGR